MSHLHTLKQSHTSSARCAPCALIILSSLLPISRACKLGRAFRTPSIPPCVPILRISRNELGFGFHPGLEFQTSDFLVWNSRPCFHRLMRGFALCLARDSSFPSFAPPRIFRDIVRW
ncbi:hypothetical protein M413DRAFT_246394 [Hebeloma cylindrosporum]|uniref:Secreted protein n=1 Tax=Hebeloma cylindrosporum TaxID=76867 RepID=A0A0C3C4B4_HEBCY|nr:hypothetical protein M413DRAFT_246394 [Hebeloma cylindrosporum h7]